MPAWRWQHLGSPRAQAYTEAGLWRGVLLDSYLDIATARNPDRLAVIDGDREISYSQLHQAVAAMAGGLRRLGTHPGDVVSWILPNWYEAIVVHHAVIRVGAVSNPIVPIYRHREVEFILRQAATRMLIVPETFRGFDYPAMVADLDIPHVQTVIVARGEAQNCLRLDALCRADAGDEQVPPDDRTADDPALLLYTSGTTAQPKGVVHSHNTLDHELRSIVQLFGLTSRDIVFMASPLTHITGVLYGIHLPMFLNSTVVLQDIWNPAIAADLIQRHAATFTVGATPFLHGLINQPDPPGGRLAMRAFACGGADVPPQLISEATRRLDCCAMRVYGSTEHPTVSACGFGDALHERAHTDGRPIGATRVRIVDDNDDEVGPDTMGEIVVRGPEQFLGYLEEIAIDDLYTSDGWFRTGDLGTIDTDGYLRVTGRKKDIIIRGGENLSVREIEDLLLEHQQISDVAVVGMPDPILGERVCAFVVAGDDGIPTLNDIVAYLRGQQVATQKLPERLEIIEDLPRTASGKVKKHLLKDRLRGLASVANNPSTAGG
jgi:cyclohexanecarboxylate-CoA ligase